MREHAIRTRCGLLFMFVWSVLVLGIPVYAAGTVPKGAVTGTKETGKGAVTINRSAKMKEGHVYTIIKVMDTYMVEPAVMEGEQVKQDAVYAYGLTPSCKSLETRLNQADSFFHFNEGNGMITLADGSEAKGDDSARLARVIANYLLETVTLEHIVKEEQFVVDVVPDTRYLEYGYYLLYESASGEIDDGIVATKPMLFEIRPDDRTTEENEAITTITLKDAEVSFDKKIVTENAVSEHNDTVSIGDVVDYEIDINFPVYSSGVERLLNPTFVILDTFSEGLTYKYTPDGEAEDGGVSSGITLFV